MALPLLADLHRAWPETHLAVAARAGRGAALCDGAWRCATIIGSTAAVGRALSTWRRNARLLAAGGFDAALLLPNSFLAAWLVARARDSRALGLRARSARHGCLTRAIPRPPTRRASGGVLPGARRRPWDSQPASASRASTSPAKRRDARSGCCAKPVSRTANAFVVIAPGAAYGRAKQWLPERFAELPGSSPSERAWRPCSWARRLMLTLCGNHAARWSGAADAPIVESVGPNRSRRRSPRFCR